MNEDHTCWVISKFNKVGSDELLEEYPLTNARLDEIQALFGLDPSEPMLDSFRVAEREKSGIERWIGRELDF